MQKGTSDSGRDAGKAVLIVDDNEDNRVIYAAALRYFGYEVREASGGADGIAQARSERPDLILMDLSMPGVDGWTATQVLKQDPATRDIPVVAVTARTLAGDRERAIEVGCDGILPKPCGPREVVVAVRRFLEERPAPTVEARAPRAD